MDTAANIIVVDDELSIRLLESRWVERAGHRCRTAASSDEALRLLEREPADLALLDVRMPGVSGLSLARKLQERYPQTAIIMATGVGEISAAVEAMQAGAVDYVLKPFRQSELMGAIERGLARCTELRTVARRTEQLEAAIRERSLKLMESLAELEVTSVGSVNALLTALRLRDGSAAEHAGRVARMAVSVALALGMKEPDLTYLENASLLHDVGKIALSDSILDKPGPLDLSERAIARQHPDLGYNIVKTVPFLGPAAEIIRTHQERFDGTGYPRGLAGEKIPLAARVLAVADAYDAMISSRPYCPAMTQGAAVTEIERCSGTQFDPTVVDAFSRLVGAIAA